MNKKEVAAKLEEIGALMELAGENPFKTRSYYNAARTLNQVNEDLETLVQEKRLREIKGVGEAIAQKIEELVTTGNLAFLEELRAQFPDTIFEIMGIPGLGPKRVKAVYDELGVDSLEKLEQACTAGQLATLKGFSDKLQQKVLDGIAFHRRHQGIHLYHHAEDVALPLREYLIEHAAVQRIEIAGSLRRRKEVIKDIDFVASSADPKAVMAHFVAWPDIDHVTGQGDTKTSVVTNTGIAVDLRVVSDTEFPYALAHFTGSKEHNVAMRQRAKERKLKLNEYGLFKEDDTRIACTEEHDIHAALDLPYIPPELREDMGEFALKETPRLVTQNDLRGVFHCHSNFSDGRNTLEEMAAAAQECGYDYLVICDHSQSAAYAHGLTPDRVQEQHAAIDGVNKKLKDFRLVKGIESDIRTDGSLDYEDDILESFEFVVISVHNKLDMLEAEATARIIKAVEHPASDLLGHPSGRLLLTRAGYPLDYEKVFDACTANGVAVEINANCHRLDLDWRYIRRAQEKGVKLAISPDAHDTAGLDYVRHGVGLARKGWLAPKDLLNCMTAKDLLAWRKSKHR
ncbi:MAG: DNA polymerase/3'-5' exonuclease PolX [Candidatus Hydrogenedentota bacterium]